MDSTNQQRRRWLSLGGIVLGASLLPNSVLAALSTPKPLSMRFRNINTGEVLTSKFYDGKKFVSTELTKLDHLMRDRRTNQVRKMDPNLFLKLSRIQTKLGMRNSEILVICGYRSAKSNAMMHRRSHGVASNSFHIKGQAIDFRIANVPLTKIRQAAESLSNGGVGYYPRSNFIHVDTGPVRTWRGV